jgi:hypothetical protein
MHEDLAFLVLVIIVDLGVIVNNRTRDPMTLTEISEFNLKRLV